jgi:hypothetical protein
MSAIEVAHIRLGSGAGLGQKPDDWNTVSLCRDCHAQQHQVGEITFWTRIAQRDPTVVAHAFCKASPRRHEIEQVKRERGL